jgi:hypothetical protein
MASSNGIANEQMVHLITQQTIDLLATMKTDISQAKSLTETDRKSCEAICQRAETEYNRLKMDFLQETLTLIDQALNTSDQQILQQIHCAWSLQLDHVTHQCERIACPLVEMLRILVRNDKSIRKKYWVYIGGATMSTLLAGIAIGFLIAHCHPGCPLQLAAEAIVLVSLGALAAIALGIGCIIGVIDINTIWTINQRCSDSVKLIINKNFGQLAELTLLIKDSIATLKITEDMWQKHVVLASIRRSVDTELKHLQRAG